MKSAPRIMEFSTYQWQVAKVKDKSGNSEEIFKIHLINCLHLDKCKWNSRSASLTRT